MVLSCRYSNAVELRELYREFMGRIRELRPGEAARRAHRASGDPPALAVRVGDTGRPRTVVAAGPTWAPILKHRSSSRAPTRHTITAPVVEPAVTIRPASASASKSRVFVPAGTRARRRVRDGGRHVRAGSGAVRSHSRRRSGSTMCSRNYCDRAARAAALGGRAARCARPGCAAPSWGWRSALSLRRELCARDLVGAEQVALGAQTTTPPSRPSGALPSRSYRGESRPHRGRTPKPSDIHRQERTRWGRPSLDSCRRRRCRHATAGRLPRSGDDPHRPVGRPTLGRCSVFWWSGSSVARPSGSSWPGPCAVVSWHRRSPARRSS
jgi:hypothetical protein